MHSSGQKYPHNCVDSGEIHVIYLYRCWKNWVCIFGFDIYKLYLLILEKCLVLCRYRKSGKAPQLRNIADSIGGLPELLRSKWFGEGADGWPNSRPEAPESARQSAARVRGAGSEEGRDSAPEQYEILQKKLQFFGGLVLGCIRLERCKRMHIL